MAMTAKAIAKDAMAEAKTQTKPGESASGAGAEPLSFPRGASRDVPPSPGRVLAAAHPGEQVEKDVAKWKEDQGRGSGWGAGAEPLSSPRGAGRDVPPSPVECSP